MPFWPRCAGIRRRHVTVTGGEPLAQKGCLPLLTALCDAGYEVWLRNQAARSMSPRSIRAW